MGPDLEMLSQRMAAMEEDALREFGDRFGPRFRSFFLSHGLPVADAEDLAVSCVTDIALKIGRYDPERGGRFEAWVFTLARRGLVDWWRRYRPAETLPEHLTAPGPEAAESDNLPAVVGAVREAVVRLSQDD